MAWTSSVHAILFPEPSYLEADYIATEVIYDIPPIHFIDLGIGFGIGGASYDVAFSEKILRTRLSADDTTIFGYVAGRVDKDIGRFRLLLHLSGLALEPRDWELHFRDIDFNASYRLFGSHDGTEARVLLGYRYLSIDYKFRDEDIRIKTDATLSGPLFGFVLSF